MSAMYSTGEESWFEGINRLLPGHFMTASPDGLTIRRWWDLPSSEDELGEHSEAYYIRKARHLLETPPASACGPMCLSAPTSAADWTAAR